MTPEDTTRLRALHADATRRYAMSDHAWMARREAAIAGVMDDLLALLDEVERLRGIVGRVGTILSDEGCDCYCDCDSHHLPECELCLGCRIGNEVDGTSWPQCGTSGGGR